MFHLACWSLAAHGQSPPQAVAAGMTIAGTVELAEGDVKVFDSRKTSRTVKAGDKVYEGDSVVTGSDGELHLAMEDEGALVVRPNTRMQILAYRAQGDEQDKGVISLLVGNLRSITGWIGKHNPKSYAIRTPSGTIGIRGTDHEPLVIPEGSMEGEPGTYDKVNIGGSYIKTSQGTVDIPARRAAFAPLHRGRASARPRLLEGVPRFFRAARHEHLMAKRHELIQRTLEQRREEKRKLIRERIKKRAKAQPTRSATRDVEARKDKRQQAREERMQRRREHDGRSPSNRREKEE